MSEVNPVFSVIVPVYNRPQEIRELLQSLTRQNFKDFEVVIIEDGSLVSSETVVHDFSDCLNLRYFVKQNEGPGPARNFGFAHARGQFFVLFDSDCIIPENYFLIVQEFIARHPVDAWGGSDRGHEDFSNIQRAMAFTMSSWITTGGIRGKLKDLRSFQPRSFNMGLRREVYQATGGFRLSRFAEDIELSLRMKSMGFSVWLIPDAWVYHKRRTTFGQFFRQVSNFGKGRILVARVHPGSIKITHVLPLLFTLGLITIPVLFLISNIWAMWVAVLYATYFVLIGFISTMLNRSLSVGLLSIVAAFIQLTGYGYGFIREALRYPTRNLNS
jgi:glycosyltransferase involved in cell wall biosynthesis